MKTLPEHPSLDHVRQQAKDLLTRRRATRPAMTLAEAQLELANEYGFRTWADLRAGVDRLRARTLVADGTVASQIADVFDLGTVTGKMVAVEQVWAGERWSLSTGPRRPPPAGAADGPFDHGPVIRTDSGSVALVAAD